MNKKGTVYFIVPCDDDTDLNIRNISQMII